MGGGVGRECHKTSQWKDDRMERFDVVKSLVVEKKDWVMVGWRWQRSHGRGLFEQRVLTLRLRDELRRMMGRGTWRNQLWRPKEQLFRRRPVVRQSCESDG